MVVEEIDPAQEFEARILLRNKAMHVATELGNSDVQQFYNGSTVFVTGGSGFLGKQFIEKLFRATKVSKVFVLLRSKKGKDMKHRLNDMLQDPVYDLLKEQQPNFADRIVPVAGDVAQLRLGMSDKDWDTIAEQVDLVFHMAATTRFDEELRVSTMINVRGTREALALGKACQKLKCFVHVSTAYSHACENLINTEVLEQFYKSPICPDTMIELAETMPEDRLKAITPSLIKNWPNTYSFAKAVAEELVEKSCGDLPLCVIRPAIVVSAQREPSPGWLDVSCIYGASGIIAGPGLGLMHVLAAKDDLTVGLIPVDYVNNVILTAAWDTAKKRAEGDYKTKIFAVTTTSRNPALWGHLHESIKGVIRENYSSPAAIFYGFAFQTTNPTLFLLYTWLLHMIPAYIIDGICLIIGKERRFVKLYKKMYKMSLSLSYFTVNEWKFRDDNTAKLFESLSPVDKEIFDFDIMKIDWVEFMILWCIGVRKYIVKDGLKNSKYGVRKQYVFRIVAYVLGPIYFYCLFRIATTALYLGYVILSLIFKMFW